MDNLWKMIAARWSEEEIARWGSLKKTAYLLLPLLIYFVVHDCAEILLWAGLNQLMTRGGKELVGFLAANAYTVNGVINGAAILLGLAVIRQMVRWEIQGAEEAEDVPGDRKKEKGSSRFQAQASDAGSVGKKGRSRDGGAGLLTGYMVLGALAFLVAVGLNLAFDLLGITAASESFTQTARAQFGVNFATGLVLYGIISPAAEEAVFRGLIFNRMKRCFGRRTAFLVSALLFGCYHMNPVQALYGTILGLLIAWVYEKYESFAAPVLFHGVANVSIYVFGFYGGFDRIGRAGEIAAAAVSLAGAGVCLWVIVRGRAAQRS